MWRGYGYGYGAPLFRADDGMEGAFSMSAYEKVALQEKVLSGKREAKELKKRITALKNKQERAKQEAREARELLRTTLVSREPPEEKKQECGRVAAKECPICLEEQTESCVYTLVPCGHSGYCKVCALKLERCAICRKAIDVRLKTYI